MTPGSPTAPTPLAPLVPSPPGAAIPWERRGEIGLLRAFRDTLVMSIREPTRFYGLAPTDASLWPALAYGLTFDLVVGVVGFAYTKLVGAAELEASIGPLYPQLRQVFPKGPELVATVTSVSAIVSLLMTPLSFLFTLGLTTIMTWIGLRIARGLTTSFGRLLRMFAYGSWIQIFGLLSITGDVLLSSLSFVLVLGFGSYYWLVIVRSSQRIDTGRAMLASLYGCLIAFAFACVLGIPLVVALGLLLASLLKSVPMLPP